VAAGQQDMLPCAYNVARALSAFPLTFLFKTSFCREGTAQPPPNTGILQERSFFMFDLSHPPWFGSSGGVMQELFSANMVCRIWRRLWLALAEAQAELGLAITQPQLTELREHLDDINHGFAALKERELKQETAAHLAAYRAQCPKARNILAMGVGDEYVRENGQVVLLRAALLRVESLLVNAIAALADTAEEQRRQPCLSYSRMLPNGVMTMGFRAALWLQDLLDDLSTLQQTMALLHLPGCKGSDGTARAMLKLFHNKPESVYMLEVRLAEKLDFTACCAVGGAAAARRANANALHALRQIAQTVAAISNDLRLLLHSGQLLEQPRRSDLPHSHGSKCERLAALSRYVEESAESAARYAAQRCMEQAQDDLLLRQMTLPQAFLAADAMLCLLIDIAEHAAVDGQTMRLRLAEALPELHDPLSHSGMAVAQTERLLYRVVDPLLKKHRSLLGLEINVPE